MIMYILKTLLNKNFLSYFPLFIHTVLKMYRWSEVTGEGMKKTAGIVVVTILSALLFCIIVITIAKSEFSGALLQIGVYAFNGPGLWLFLSFILVAYGMSIIFYILQKDWARKVMISICYLEITSLLFLVGFIIGLGMIFDILMKQILLISLCSYTIVANICLLILFYQQMKGKLSEH